MKKIITMAMCAIVIASLASCKSKTASPSQSAQQSAEYLKSGNYDQFVEYLYFEPNMTAEAEKAEKAKSSVILKQGAHPRIEGKGGIKSVNVASEKVSDDGKNAEVVLTNTYNNGETEKFSYDMILVGNEWKVKVGNDKEVWKTHTPSGEKVAFKIKENDYKDFVKKDVDGERDFVKEIHTDDKEVLKIKEEDEKTVIKVKDKNDEEVIKIKEDGDKEVIRVDK